MRPAKEPVLLGRLLEGPLDFQPDQFGLDLLDLFGFGFAFPGRVESDPLAGHFRRDDLDDPAIFRPLRQFRKVRIAEEFHSLSERPAIPSRAPCAELRKIGLLIHSEPGVLFWEYARRRLRDSEQKLGVSPFCLDR